MGDVEKRLAELGLELPPVTPPPHRVITYRSGRQAIWCLSPAKGPRRAGDLVWKGIVGDDLTLENARDAACMCALNLLAQLTAACDGDLNRMTGVIRLAGLMRCTVEFEQQAKELNAASDLICDVFGSAGAHARIASGTHALPSGMAVEIEAIFEVAPAA